jgi:type IV secretory pathway VirB3-like protein
MDYLTTTLYQAILWPRLLFGVPRNFFIMLAAMTAGMVLALQLYWFLIVFIAIIAIFNPLSKAEPYFFEMVTGLLRLPNYDLD